MEVIFKARAFIEKIILCICAVLVFMISFLILLQIVMRTLGMGINWTEEVARFSFVSLTFLGSSLAVTRTYHITITFLAEMLPTSVRRYLDAVIHVVMAAFMCVCTYGMTLIMTAAKGVTSSSMTWFHLNYLYTLITAGCILMTITCLLKSLEFIVYEPEYHSEREG